MQHAKLSPSSAEQWVNCPGSVEMQERYPEDTERQEAKEGQAVHAIGETLLKGGSVEIGDVVNDVIVTEEMLDCALVWVTDVRDTALERGQQLANGFFWVEQRVYSKRIHPIDSWGTCDTALFFPEDDDLFIWDYKNGHGIVEAYNNWQCLDYAEGFLELLQGLGYERENINVWVNIVQPRSFHPEGPIRRWFVPKGEIGKYTKKLHDAALLALKPDPPCISGEHCRYCSARTKCATNQKSAYCVVEYAQTRVVSEMTAAEAGQELTLLKKAAKMLEHRITGLEVHVETAIKKGEPVPGWRTEPKLGNLTWKKSYEDVIALGKALGVDLDKKALLTPTQAIDKGLDENIIKSIAERPAKGVKIVPDDGTKAKRIFAREGK